MKKRIVWLVVSCLMVASLVVASCAPAVEEEGEVAPPVKEKPAAAEEEEVGPAEEKEMVRDSLGRLVEKPRYGGVFKYVLTQNPQRFDDVFGVIHNSPTMYITNEDLMQGDWAKGPAGTAEYTCLYTMLPPPGTGLAAGGLAESWELIEPRTLVFHIRKGIHWHDKPPVNGRELTADDVVFSFKRLWDSPTQWRHFAYPWDEYLESITALDKWTVAITYLPGKAAPVFEFVSDHSRVVPHEAIEEYGDLGKWQNSCGTGAFMLVDYVSGSSVTFVRNPNYWMKDPLHPENSLPYLDGLKWLIIQDASTQIAALRTGKIDHLNLGWEDAEQLLKTSPQLNHLEWLSSYASTLHWRVDKPPFDDLRVRRALAMALDNQEIADTYYGGYTELLTYPTANIPEFKDMFIPLDEFSESIREQFEYHPEKARQLLAEAGYPDGFKTEVVCYSAHVDLLSIVKDQWAKIGVDLELIVKEYGVYSSIGQRKTYEQIYMWYVSGTIPTTFIYLIPENLYNYSMVDDPLVTEAHAAVTDAFFDWSERCRVMKDITPHILEQAYVLQFPGGYAFTFWQPWVKNYHGEQQVGYAQAGDFVKYIQIDQDLKEEMTGKR